RLVAASRPTPLRRSCTTTAARLRIWAALPLLTLARAGHTGAAIWPQSISGAASTGASRFRCAPASCWPWTGSRSSCLAETLANS
ncbi:hypothetical protein GGF38_004182, partial [Coemansia sp. RSA 25]